MDEYQDNDELKELIQKENPELKQGHEYIIKRSMYEPFYIKVLNVTEKCYHFKYENGNTTWVEKNYYESTYTFVEDITDTLTG